MKRKRIVVVASVIMVVAIVTLSLRLWPRVLTTDDCGALYQWCKDVDGVDVMYIKDYYINDSLKVKMTTIMAKTDTSWNDLLYAFSIEKPSEKVFELNKGDVVEVANASALDCPLKKMNIIKDSELISIFWKNNSQSSSNG